MNRDMKFGSSVIGNYVTVKLNAKIEDSSLVVLEITYKSWLKFIDNGKHGTRIEGVLPVDMAGRFFGYDLKVAIMNSKVSAMKEELNELHDQWEYKPLVNTCWTKADLDEI